MSNSASILGQPEAGEAGEQEIGETNALGLSPDEAARTILRGVRNGEWRILVGADTQSLDALVRASPETAYDPDFVLRWREANSVLSDANRMA